MGAPNRLVVRALAWLGIVAVAAGCEDPAPGPRAGTADGGPRIVSLSPALSRMVVDLGLEPSIVGRSAFCDFLDPAIPVVGDLHRVDYERLVAVRPTHLLVQAPREGPDARLLDLATRRRWRVGQFSGLDTVDDIERVLRELPSILAEPGSEMRGRLTRRAAVLLNEMAAALSPGEGDRWRGPTLLVYRLEPVGVFGRRTYLSDVLVRLGAANATDAEHWAELTLEDVVRLDPPAILLIRPGADPGLDPIEAAGPLAALEIGAVRNGRIAVVTSPEALRPSTGIIEVAGQIRQGLAALGAGGQGGAAPAGGPGP